MAQGDHGAGLVVAVGRVRRIIGQTVTDYPLHGVPLPFSAGAVLRDRNGGLWIGTAAHGLVHSYEGETSIFTHKDGLSSDQVHALFEGREGSIWVATSEGLDQFRELPVTALPVKQGSSSPTTNSVLAARDGSIWIGTTGGLYRWDHGRTTVYGRRSNLGLADDEIQSLFEDERGRIWVSSFSGLAAFGKGKFTAVPSVPAGTKNAITGDNHGGLWLSLFGTANNYSLTHLVDGKITEQVPWRDLGGGPGTGLLPDPNGGIWTGLLSGGIAYFRAGQIRTLPLSDDGAGARKVFDISRDRGGHAGQPPTCNQRIIEHRCRNPDHRKRVTLQDRSLDHRRRPFFLLALHAVRAPAHSANRVGGLDRRPETKHPGDNLRCHGRSPAGTDSQGAQACGHQGVRRESLVCKWRRGELHRSVLISTNMLAPPVHVEQVRW